MGVALYAALAASGQTTRASGDATALSPTATASALTFSVSSIEQAKRFAAPPATTSTNSGGAPAGDSTLQALSAATPSATPTASATPTVTPTPGPPACEKSPSRPLYCIYTVQSGDTLSGIAKAFGIGASGELAPAELLEQSNKPDVSDANTIVPGHKLRIPVQTGIIHTVFVSESVSQVATGYGVSAASIQGVTGNGLSGSDALSAGAEVLIPNPTKLPSAAPVASPTPAATATAQATATATAEPTSTPAPEPTATPEPAETPAARGTLTGPTRVPPPVDALAPSSTAVPATATRVPATPTPTPSAAASAPSRAGFIWPASGPISSYFGPSHPLGIDIDFFATPNQPVKAAAGGTVTFAGGDPCCSYGIYVIIDHGNGFTTLYGHLSQVNVRQGQTVSQGTVIGLGGRTGYATGNHLHFEVRLNGQVVNPLNYLP